MSTKPINNINNHQIAEPIEKEEESKIANFAKILFSSPTLWLSLISLGLAVFTPIAFHYALPLGKILTIDAIGLGIIGAIYFKQKRMIDYEITFADSVIREKLSPKKWAWYTQMDENVILGAMPLKNKDNMNELIKLSRGKLAILSTLEDWEMNTQTVLTNPVTPQDWQKNNITQNIVAGEDHIPPSLENLEKSVKFMLDQTAQGKKVYVHCKAGRGRSATTLACYYMVKNNLTPEQAIKLIENKRSIVTLYKKEKIARINEFYEKICPKMREEISKKNLPWYRSIF
jgi:atypical dual specificity phosphatase